MPEREPRDFESILQHVYGRGHFLRLLFVVCSITTLLAGLEVQSLIFMNYTPEHNCSDHIVVNGPYTVHWLSQKPTSDANHTQLLQSSAESPEQCWALLHDQSDRWTHFTCTNWTYAVAPMIQTVVSQFNLVCERQVWLPWLESTYLFSNALGFIIASIGDKVGRKKAFLAFVVLEILTTVATPFSNSVGLLLCLRCLRGLSICLTYLGINLLSELVPIHLRAAYGNVYWLLWGVGYSLSAGLAHLTKDWIQLRLWMCAFLVLYLASPFVLCESPRWLCLQGHPEKASRVLRRVAYWNRAQLSDAYFDKMDIFLQRESCKANMTTKICPDSVWRRLTKLTGPAGPDSWFDLFTHPNLRKRVMVFSFMHTAITVVYFGIITNGSFATEDIFLNVFLMGLMEIPSGFVSWAVCEYVGRRLSTTILFVLTALCVGMTEVGSLFNPIAQAVMATSAKFFLSVVYCVSDLYIFESFPTSIRTSSFFTVITVAGVFGAVAPFINNLRRVARILPTCIFCAVSLIGAMMVLAFLPETRDCPLAQTVEESEQFVRGKEREWAERMRQSSKNVILRHRPIEVTDEEVTDV